MKPLSTVTSIVTRPPRAARSVAGLAASAAASGIRTSGRLVGWAAGRALGDRAVEQPAPVWTEATTPVTEEVAQPTETVDRVEPVEATPPPAPAEPDVQPTAKKAPARTSRRAPAKRTPSAKLPPAKKVSAKKAPSAKAATAGPARAAAKKKSTNRAAAKKKPAAATPSPTDVTTPEPEPLLDSSTAKAVAKEAEVLQRAADPDKG